MATFDENGNYIKTDWKAGDKITAAKLNKIEESIEAVNNNDISRHVEADARLDKLESGAVSDKQEINAKIDALEDVMEANKDATDLEIYSINAHMTLLDKKIDDGVAEVNEVADNMQTAMNEYRALVNNVDAKINAMENEVNAQLDATQNNMDNIQDDLNNSYEAVEVVNENCYKFMVGVGSNGDFSEAMVKSLITIDDIVGQSSTETNVSKKFKYLVSTAVNHICTVDISKNYFDDAVQDNVAGDVTVDRNGNTVRVVGPSEWNAVMYRIPTLEIGKKYCFMCDNTIIASGDAMMQVSGLVPAPCQTGYLYDSYNLNDSSFNRVSLVGSNNHLLTLHCSPFTTGGDVTYENIQVYEVKEYNPCDIQLNSIPDGVYDEVKDGMLIKRTHRLALKDLYWMASSGNKNNPDSEFVVFYADAPKSMRLPVDANDTAPIMHTNMLNYRPTSYTTSLATNNEVCISGHPNGSEFRIKARRSLCPDVVSMVNWLNTYNVEVIYELEMYEAEDVNLSIKADKGDMVVINTCKPLTCSHDIQLNTRSQINELQEQVQLLCELVGSMGPEIKELFAAKLVTDKHRFTGSVALQPGTTYDPLEIKDGVVYKAAGGTDVIINSITGDVYDGSHFYLILTSNSSGSITVNTGLNVTVPNGQFVISKPQGNHELLFEFIRVPASTFRLKG